MILNLLDLPEHVSPMTKLEITFELGSRPIGQVGKTNNKVTGEKKLQGRNLQISSPSLSHGNLEISENPMGYGLRKRQRKDKWKISGSPNINASPLDLPEPRFTRSSKTNRRTHCVMKIYVARVCGLHCFS